MKLIKENVVIQIEITNACHLSCANCSRLVGHHKNPFYMTLETVKKAIISLNGFQGRIGLMGGEPALHPNFKEICETYIQLIPDRRRRELWTSGYKWDEYKEIRELTFDPDLVHYNDHSRPEEGWHQPLLISIDDVVEDKEKMWKLINNCWVQRRWSASITPKGAYFCEVAAALHHALDGPDGWSLGSEWWKNDPEKYEEQKKFACLRCSAALPMAEIPNNHVPQDLISLKNLEILKSKGSPKVRNGRVIIIKPEEAVSYLDSVKDVEEGERGYLKSHPDWRPSEFRTKVWHKPGEGDLTAAEVRAMHKKGEKLNDTIISKGVNNKIISESSGKKLILTKEIIESYSIDVSNKAFLIKPLIGIEFNNLNDFYRSVDEWSDFGYSDREKDILLRHLK